MHVIRVLAVACLLILAWWALGTTEGNNEYRIRHLPSPQRQEVEALAEEDVGQPNE